MIFIHVRVGWKNKKEITLILLQHSHRGQIQHVNTDDLTHWGRVTHICVSKQAIIGSDNGLSPARRQAIIWTNAEILLIWPLGTNFIENLIKLLTFSFTKMRLKVSSAKWRPFCLDLNVLIEILSELHFAMGKDNSSFTVFYSKGSRVQHFM